MKRISLLLVALLALVATACSSGTPSSPAPTPTPAPTEEATPEPTESEAPEATEAPEASDDGSESDSALADLLPDELNGVSRTDIPGLEAMLEPMLAQSGLDASEADFIFASYGEGPDAVIVQAIQIPGLSAAQLQTLAQAMSGSQAGGGVSIEPVTVAGKDVLQLIGPEMPGGAYMYLSDGAMFTVISESADLAEQLLAELP